MFALVAQLVEQLPFKEKVARSSRAEGTLYNLIFKNFRHFFYNFLFGYLQAFDNLKKALKA